MSDRAQLTRRDLLKLTTCALAASGASEFFTAWLDAAKAPAHLHAAQDRPALRDYQPQFFDADDFAALQVFTEILIPTDDTPGAREARCAHFIDFVLAASTDAAPDAQAQWRDAMRAVKASGFHTASAAERERLVAAMARPERERGATHPAYFAYRLIKQQNTFAFYTSRAGLIEALDYKGNRFNASFPACEHPEHRVVPSA
ncbi:MAG: gluconate 2-dehydrogenase subunit 3 family protein [Acidobacteria bacterium]|nr:gluconate 2-dehydrogenase subunit 3 family protein [Acidobacteriota bacterium]